MKKTLFPTLLLVFVLIISCGKKTTLQNGIWRGELTVQERQVPFLFEVKNADTDSSTITLTNGEERVDLSGVKSEGDTLIIPIDAYDAVIKGTVDGNEINGRFIKNYIENDAGVVFKAQYNNKNRFIPATQPTSKKIDGKWDVLFIDEKGDTTRNVGIFVSENGIVTGSILTNSGDLRYLEGAYTDNGVQLSAFSGLSPYLFEFNFVDEHQLNGTFYTVRGATKLTGTKNNNAGMTDAYNIAKLKSGYKTLSFKLPNLDGKEVTLTDERYKNKVVVVSILGSWCPNCLDEAQFLAPWYNDNNRRGVEIIGLGFERKDDYNYAHKTLSRLKEKYGINYEILFAGKVAPETLSKVLPEIDNFSGYPTTIFIDKKGNVRKIHTGFNGPATGLFYEDFKVEFNKLIDDLLNEK